MKKILVTGGTGFIGSALVKRLLNEGYGVRVFDNHSRGQISRLEEHKNLEVMTGDIRNLELVRKAVQGFSSVMHLAYVNGTEFFYTQPDRVLDVAIRGMLNLMDAAKESGVQEFILASSSEVYQSPPQIPTPEEIPLVVPDVKNPRYSYGGGKILCELMAIHMASRFIPRVIIFRPHNVYGPDMGFEHVIPQFVKKALGAARQSLRPLPFPIQGSGRQTRSFIYIDDFVDAVIMLMRQGQSGEIYHIGSEDEISMRDLALKVSGLLGYEITFVEEPEARGGTQRRLPDISKMRTLGFCPLISLDEGLKRSVSWYRRHFDDKGVET